MELCSRCAFVAVARVMSSYAVHCIRDASIKLPFWMNFWRFSKQPLTSLLFGNILPISGVNMLEK